MFKKQTNTRNSYQPQTIRVFLVFTMFPRRDAIQFARNTGEEREREVRVAEIDLEVIPV